VAGALLREIRGVLDELDIIIDIKSQQQKVLKEFKNSVEYMMAHSSTTLKEMGLSKHEEVTGDDGDGHRTVYQRQKSYNTLQTGKTLMASLENHVSDIKSLKEKAQRAEKNVSHRVLMIAVEANS